MYVYIEKITALNLLSETLVCRSILQLNKEAKCYYFWSAVWVCRLWKRQQLLCAPTDEGIPLYLQQSHHSIHSVSLLLQSKLLIFS